MEINRLIIDRCGLFHGTDVGPLQPGFSLWYGPNEAGKSTMLDFIRIMLWGTQSRSYARYRQEGVAGELWLRDGGQELRISRQKRVQYLLDGQPVDPTVAQAWMNKLSMTVFESVYAFGLSELQTFETLSQDEVRGRIYSAGLGTGALSVVDFRNRLVKARQALYAPRGEKPALNQALQRLEALRQELSLHQHDWDQYQSWQSERDTIRQRVRVLDQETMPALTAALAKARRRLEREAEGFRWQALRREASELQLASLTRDDAAAQIQEAQHEWDAARQDLHMRDQAVQELEAQRAAYARRGAWLNRWGNPVAEWLGCVEEFGQSWDSAVRLRAEAENKFSERVRGWPAPLLDRVLEGVVPLRHALESAEAAVRDAQGERDDAQSRLQAVMRDMASIGEVPEPPVVATVEEWEQLERRFREALSRSGSVAGPDLWLLPAAAACLIVAVIESPAAFVKLIVVAALLLVAGAFLVRFSARGTAAIRSTVALTAERLGLSSTVSATEVSAVLDRLAHEIKSYQETLERQQALRRDRDLAEHAAAVAAGAHQAAQDHLSGLLATLGLAGWPWEDIRPMLGEAVTVESWNAAREDADGHVSRLEDEWAAWMEAWEPALRDWGNGARVAARDWRGLRQVLLGMQQELGEWQRLSEELILRQQRQADASERVQHAEAALRRVLHNAGFADLSAYSAYRQSREALDHIEARLREIAMGWDSLPPSDRAWLETLDEDIVADTEREAQMLEGRLESARQERLALQTRLTELDVAIRAMEEDNQATRLRQQIAVAETEVQNLAREWAALTMVEEAVQRSRQVFENERQPAIMTRAEEFFAAMTAGRYPRVRALLDGQSLEVEDRQGRRCAPERLSRGTQEQLYLAIRLAWIEAMDARHERTLPVLFDDILVNFDPERTYRTLEVLREFSPGRQLLMWTCHPHIAESAASLGARVWRESVS